MNNKTKFEECYDEIVKNFPVTESRDSCKFTWNRCKREVLRILEKKNIPIYVSEDDYSDTYLDKEALKNEIEDL